MVYGGGPQKLKFSIHSCSGEDPDYPARQLLLHSLDNRGWQTPRFCSYPQEIILQLEQQCRLQQIQLLAHEYKIPQRIEIFLAAMPVGETDMRKAVETRLGFLSLQSNERSGHQARELKSVGLQNNPASLVRLVLHRCHVNKLNIYNQAGVLALNLIGEPDERMLPGTYSHLASGEGINDPYQHQSRMAQIAMADLQLDLHVDPKTAARIRQLHLKKENAVRVENYDEAKHLKGCIERLKQLGQKIAQLEAQKLSIKVIGWKEVDVQNVHMQHEAHSHMICMDMSGEQVLTGILQAAVEREDFDEAKAVKADVDRLRAIGENVAMGSESTPRKANDPEQIFNRVLGKKVNGSVHTADHTEDPHSQAATSDSPPIPSAQHMPNDQSVRMPSPAHFDEQPVAAAAAAHSADGGENQGGISTPPRNGVRAAAHVNDSAAPIEESNDPQPPPGFTSDLPMPAPLSTADANDGDALMTAFGEYVSRCMYSKSWLHRAAVYKYMAEQVANGSFKDHRLLIKYLQKGLQEKVVGLVTECGALMRVTISKGGKLVTHLTQALLPLLLERMGDGIARIAETMREVVLELADSPDSDLASMTSLILKQKKTNQWRPMLVRLNLLELLIPKFHISTGKDSFDLSELMAFVSAGFSYANGDVRAASVRVTAAAFQEVGHAVTKHIPNSINSKVKEQIYEAIGMEPEASPPPPAPEPPRPPPKKRTSTGVSAPSSAKAPTKGKEKAKTKSGFSANLTGLADSPSPAPAPPAASTSDDPQVYERELERKERDLGPHHPEVADCLSNIAILYNQRGEQSKALPMYERALKIFEKTRGPESQDVAHTLTDLAVLHLEQGREDVGRPLLERALDIQQKALGPDHPDVVAILDVLHGDD